MYSVLIRGGEIVDGSGKQSYTADIAVKDDRIVEIGTRLVEAAEQEIDARDLTVAPGFIDIHTHTDRTIFGYPLSDSKLLQGVTTEVIGNCGMGPFPASPKKSDAFCDYLRARGYILPAEGIRWRNMAEYAAELERMDLGTNLIPLVPHVPLRSVVMGFDDRRPTESEMVLMQKLLDEALTQGAWGFSTGLIYPPSSFAEMDELLSLTGVLVPHGAIYTSHIRGESTAVLQALDEAIEVAQEAKVRVQVSHLKAMGKANWGKGKVCLDKIEAARQQGADIGADQYPYTASSASLTALVPQWAHSGGVQELLSRLRDPSLLKRIHDEAMQEIRTRGGADRIQVSSTKTLADVAETWNVTPAEAAIRLILENDGKITAVYFSMSPEDVEAIMAKRNVGIGSDGAGMSADAEGSTTVHPRCFGTFPRVLARYVREKQILSLETAIYKMTRLAAQRMGCVDRGLIKPGLAADLTLFDAKTITDTATFARPNQYPTGIEYVFVNGQMAVRDGRLTGVGAGRVLRKHLS